jgi:hypothetical protein
MINVIFQFNSDELIESMSISGHANFADSGSDIICASASTLLYTTINALADLCGLSGFYRIRQGSKKSKEPDAMITIPPEVLAKGKDTPTYWIMSMARIGFITMENTDKEEYDNRHVKVIEKHVKHFGGVRND